jgi:hypothetical protein
MTIDLPELANYLTDGYTNTIKIDVLWDKYNSGLLCTKIFTLVDKHNLLADIKILSANSIELWITLASATAAGVAGAVAKEIISYLIKRKKTNPADLQKTIIIINDHSININTIYNADHPDLPK